MCVIYEIRPIEKHSSTMMVVAADNIVGGGGCGAVVEITL